MNSQTSRRPRIGIVTMASGNQYTAVELLDNFGDLTGYSDRLDGLRKWTSHADFTPLADLPEPRMDEPQETWATVASMVAGHRLGVFIRTHDGTWRRCFDGGSISLTSFAWSDLIDPRPTTPTERETGLVNPRSE